MIVAGGTHPVPDGLPVEHEEDDGREGDETDETHRNCHVLVTDLVTKRTD